MLISESFMNTKAAHLKSVSKLDLFSERKVVAHPTIKQCQTISESATFSPPQKKLSQKSARVQWRLIKKVENFKKTRKIFLQTRNSENFLRPPSKCGTAEKISSSQFFRNLSIPFLASHSLMIFAIPVSLEIPQRWFA